MGMQSSNQGLTTNARTFAFNLNEKRIMKLCLCFSVALIAKDECLYYEIIFLHCISLMLLTHRTTNLRKKDVIANTVLCSFIQM